MAKRTGRGFSFTALVLVFLLSAVLTTAGTVAARDDDRRDRIRFYGLVEMMPEGLHGVWIIGGQQVMTSPGTEFDQLDGPLMVGGCAKVDIRDGFVHEIDSEPLQDCRGR